jgi:hypothetical protein
MSRQLQLLQSNAREVGTGKRIHLVSTSVRSAMVGGPGELFYWCILIAMGF